MDDASWSLPDVPSILRELCRSDGNIGNDDPRHHSVVLMMISVRRQVMGLKLHVMQKMFCLICKMRRRRWAATVGKIVTGQEHNPYGGGCLHKKDMPFIVNGIFPKMFPLYPLSTAR